MQTKWFIGISRVTTFFLGWTDKSNSVSSQTPDSIVCMAGHFSSPHSSSLLPLYPGHSQILSRSRGEKLGEGLGSNYVTDWKWWTRLVQTESTISGSWHSFNPRPSPDCSPRLQDKIWEGPGYEATSLSCSFHRTCPSIFFPLRLRMLRFFYSLPPLSPPFHPPLLPFSTHSPSPLLCPSLPPFFILLILLLLLLLLPLLLLSLLPLLLSISPPSSPTQPTLASVLRSLQSRTSAPRWSEHRTGWLQRWSQGSSTVQR